MTHQRRLAIPRCAQPLHRRNLLKIATASTVGAAFKPTTTLAQEGDSNQQALRLRIAGYKYDRVEALIDGRVRIDRCETQFDVSKIGVMNTTAFSGPQTWEITEIGLIPYLLAFANEGFRDYQLIPVFPL
ncbi:MAG: hypothetical protein AAF961_07410, partial [Planctomycetota bacterium]